MITSPSRLSYSAVNSYSDEWRDIPGYEGWYEVSSLGQVRSWKNSRHGRAAEPRLLKPGPTSMGYPSVGLWSGNRRITRPIHRLVALAFIGPRPDGMEVAHINGDMMDARLCNLRYATPTENQADRLLHGTGNNGERHGLSKLTWEAVSDIRDRYKPFGTPNQRELAEEYGVSNSCISRLLRGKGWTH